MSGRVPGGDGLAAGVRALMTEPRQVIARARFRGPPGQEQRAAQAWASELTYYFTRGVGEPPQVVYEDGIYTCTGLMQTTHPGDTAFTEFSWGEPPSLDSVLDPERQQCLRELYAKGSLPRFDGR